MYTTIAVRNGFRLPELEKTPICTISGSLKGLTMQQIEDYLQTQSLRLNADAVAVARAAAMAVMTQGQAHIECDVLLHDALPASLAENLPALKQLFMALDSVFSRQSVRSAALYGRLPENGELVRLTQQGQPLENRLPAGNEAAEQWLAVRTAQSGWANIAEDIGRWLDLGELSGTHNRRAAAQTSLPVCGEDGRVFGVLHIEMAAALNAEELAEWVGLALGVLPLLGELLPQPPADDEAA